MSWYREWKPYVPVAKRRAQATSYAAKLAKKEQRQPAPIKIEGRAVARTFWGKAWCDNLESYSDFANRLPRGRTYVRNGSVVDLTIARGKIAAIVGGSEVYEVTIQIQTLGKPAWKRLRTDCAQSVHSVLDLLQGRFDQGVMQRLTQCDGGLFPKPAEIEMKCSCPDWAGMCKHVAAVLYGVGARLDVAPELLFTLRNVDHLELIGEAVSPENLDRALATGSGDALAGSDLGEMFGIELDVPTVTPAKQPRASRKRAKVTAAVVATPVAAVDKPRRRGRAAK
jgi:uncharacterized Zn finger protein